ncbi:molybdate ABC transporter permease subunit [Alloalcanivorax profundimaris]|uniref:Molybdenum transport system permease n=1 Tax=Alloalcanivorax profundimaris TaxID=2735259 RepID=A0ABS0AMQ1_9GAMM|nr:molybdate ABC transporter permease subunit [Alloalcanivorax profundimaris]MAO58982.1 molybdate ABC transporter permease subunit [Alcanivorax sp.]MCQ6261635.1 molybdate ABC transporter permease subunit [Alcanivorax sp. MM125-6]MBF1801478.1 molybdate ABC transporter permease subunit [Alloalcanivorax profundimaris]MBF5055414.1 molybdate ABC transporter permease [Alloalcanivorax profundimaris]MBI55489.1 molybdate ABC transporter permease subunit [Alcanivorax sp.]
MNVSPADWQALWVSVRLALISTGLLLVICTPLAWWLARRRRPGQALLESVLALPLVLPPTVLGFYLLLWLGPDGPGGLLARLWGGHSLAFTFTGLVIGSVIYSLPFVLQPLKNAFAAIDRDTLDMAATLGAPPWDRFRNVVMPLARPGYLSAAVLGFAHTLGEFGVVLMIGGSLAGETRVASVALYEHVEVGDYARAHHLALVLVVLSVAMLWGLFRWQRRPGALP